MRARTTTGSRLAASARSRFEQSFASAAACSGRSARAQSARILAGRAREHALAQLAHREAGDLAKRVAILGRQEGARQLVALGRDHGLLDEARERELGERALRGDALLRARGGQAGELVSALRLVRLGEELPEIPELEAAAREAGHRAEGTSQIP